MNTNYCYQEKTIKFAVQNENMKPTISEKSNRLYTKFYLYSKVKTPSEMRRQFISEHKTLEQFCR